MIVPPIKDEQFGELRMSWGDAQAQGIRAELFSWPAVWIAHRERLGVRKDLQILGDRDALVAELTEMLRQLQSERRLTHLTRCNIDGTASRDGMAHPTRVQQQRLTCLLVEQCHGDPLRGSFQDFPGNRPIAELNRQGLQCGCVAGRSVCGNTA